MDRAISCQVEDQDQEQDLAATTQPKPKNLDRLKFPTSVQPSTRQIRKQAHHTNTLPSSIEDEDGYNSVLSSGSAPAN